jgi:hypothetical protein
MTDHEFTWTIPPLTRTESDVNDADREFAAEILQREGSRRVARIEPGDPDDLRNSLLDAANRCDDVAAQVLALEPAESEVEAGLFVALVEVARLYVSSIGGDVDSMLAGLRENLEPDR